MNALACLHLFCKCTKMSSREENHFPTAHYTRLKPAKPMKSMSKTPSTHCSEFRMNAKCIQYAILPYMSLSAIHFLILCSSSCRALILRFSCTGYDLELIRPLSCCKQRKWRDLTHGEAAMNRWRVTLSTMSLSIG